VFSKDLCHPVTPLTLATPMPLATHTAQMIKHSYRICWIDFCQMLL